jgi:hypothetical protein
MATTTNAITSFQLLKYGCLSPAEPSRTVILSPLYPLGRMIRIKGGVLLEQGGARLRVPAARVLDLFTTVRRSRFGDDKAKRSLTSADEYCQVGRRIRPSLQFFTCGRRSRATKGRRTMASRRASSVAAVRGYESRPDSAAETKQAAQRAQAPGGAAQALVTRQGDLVTRTEVINRLESPIVVAGAPTT